MCRQAAAWFFGGVLGLGMTVRSGAADSPELAAIVVTATRVAESSRDLPVSIDKVDRRMGGANQS